MDSFLIVLLSTLEFNNQTSSPGAYESPNILTRVHNIYMGESMTPSMDFTKTMHRITSVTS